MEHQYEQHENCELLYCCICNAGMKLCKVCGGEDRSLTTECPGERITEEQEDQIYNHELDFIGGKWKSVYG